MGTLNKALKCLFEHAYGRLPGDTDEEWSTAATQVYTTIARSSGADPAKGLQWRDVYGFMSKEVQGGASTKAIDALFRSFDQSSHGLITCDEFREVVMSRLSSLRDEKQLEERLAVKVPRIHVVPGSNKLNHLAKTEAFKVQVVTRKWVRELAEVWGEMDADGDGWVCVPDLKRYFIRAQPGLLPFLPSIFRAIEGEHRTGKISFKQFLKALYPEATSMDLRTLQAMSADKRQRLAQAAAEAAANDKLLGEIATVFNVFDDDHSGELDEDEFCGAMELTGHTKAEAAEIFKVVDTDGSGTVSWDEFRVWYTQHYARYMDNLQRKALDETEDENFGYDG